VQAVSAGFPAAAIADSRRTANKLLIEWTRNATEPAALSVTSSGQRSAAYLPVKDVANGLGESFRYCVLDSGCPADSTWFPFPEDEDAEFDRGWWSDTASKEDKTFAANPYVEITYAAAAPWRKANTIAVVSTTYYGRIGKFKLWWKRSTDADWQHGTEYTLTSAIKEVDLGSVLDLKAVKVEVTETSQASDYARLVEVDAIWREDLTSLVSSMTVRKRREHLIAAQVAYGSFGASELDVTLLETTGKFKGAGDYVRFIGPNLRVTPYFGIWTGAAWEYVPQGTFYTEDDWNLSEGMEVSFTARDAVKFLQQRYVEEHLTRSIRTDNVFRHLAHRGHERYGNISLGSFTATYPYIWFEPSTVYEALVDLARAEQATIYYTELGVLRVDDKDHLSTVPSTATITDSELFGAEIAEPVRANYVTYVYRQATLGIRQEIGKMGEELTVGAGKTESIIGTFDKAPVASVTSPTVTADSPDIIVDRWWTNGVQWSITVTNSGGSAGNITEILWFGTPLIITDEKQRVAKDADLIRRHGKHDLTIDPPIVGMASADAYARAAAILARLKSGSRQITLTMQSQPHWQHGDVVTVNSSRAGVNADYAIQSIELDKDWMTLELMKK